MAAASEAAPALSSAQGARALVHLLQEGAARDSVAVVKAACATMTSLASNGTAWLEHLEAVDGVVYTLAQVKGEGSWGSRLESTECGVKGGWV